MKRTVVLFLFLGLVITSCSSKQITDMSGMEGNLEPELWQTQQILNLTRGRPLTEKEKQALASKTDINFNLDLSETQEVRQFLQYFAEDRRETMTRWLERASTHLPFVRAMLASYKLPPDLIVLPFIESGYNSMAYSHAGAGGMWQFMPFTGKRYGLVVDWWVDERRNPYLATVAACKYLSELYQMFGDWNLALAAYNAGEGKISRSLAKSGTDNFFDLANNTNLLKRETQHYVPKFLAVLKIFRNLETLGFKSVNWSAGETMEEVVVPGGTDLTALAEASGMNWFEFSQMNPSFRRQVSPPDRSSPVYLPKTKKQLALNYLKNTNAHPPKGFSLLALNGGESWPSLSRRTGIPESCLRELNRGNMTLAAGQQIRIPLHGNATDSALAASEVALPKAGGGSVNASGKPVAVSRQVASVSGNGSKHRVRRGETLHSISSRYGVNPTVVAKANPRAIKKGRVLSGAVLNIPGGKVIAEAPAAPTAKTAKAKPTKHSSHVVKPGDTLFSLSKRYGVDQRTILASNSLSSAQQLRAGMSLSIPGISKNNPVSAQASKNKANTVRHTVTKGETVYSIARKFNVSPKEIMASNNLSNKSVLKKGDRLLISK